MIVVSNSVRQHLFLAHQFPASFVSLLPNGVDVAAYEAADGGAQRSAWGVPADALVVGMVGRLNAKGQSGLLAAAPEILAQIPNLWFVLVGPEGLLGDRERLCAQAKRLGIEARVVLPGLTEDVPSAMAAFDVLAHLPKDESFGLAPAEAMASGVPVVATDIGGCREVVYHGVTGTLVPWGDTQALVSALCDVFAGPDALSKRQRFGEAGRRRIHEHFSLDTQIDKLMQLYQQVIRTHQSLPAAKPIWASRPFLRAISAACVLCALTLGGVSLARVSHDHYVHNKTALAHRRLPVRMALRPNPHVPRR